MLVADAGARSLGGPLTWAVRSGASSLRVIVEAADAGDDVAGRLARQAGRFALPIVVERVVGTSVQPAVAAAVPDVTDADPAAVELATSSLAGTGLDVVVAHGVVRGEYLGLEVARVVDGPDGEPVLEVGVGRFDREISSMMFASVPTDEAVAKAVDLVARHRRAGGPPHPLRDLVPERWLRHLLVEDPSLVGARTLAPADTTYDAPSLREPQPAAAVGELDGAATVVVATAGVDLDAVVVAADTRAAIAGDAELIVCGPARHLVDATRAVGAVVSPPVRFVAVELPY